MVFEPEVPESTFAQKRQRQNLGTFVGCAQIDRTCKVVCNGNATHTYLQVERQIIVGFCTERVFPCFGYPGPSGHFLYI